MKSPLQKLLEGNCSKCKEDKFIVCVMSIGEDEEEEVFRYCQECWEKHLDYESFGMENKWWNETD